MLQGLSPPCYGLVTFQLPHKSHNIEQHASLGTKQQKLYRPFMISLLPPPPSQDQTQSLGLRRTPLSTRRTALLLLLLTQQELMEDRCPTDSTSPPETWPTDLGNGTTGILSLSLSLSLSLLVLLFFGIYTISISEIVSETVFTMLCNKSSSG